MSEAAEMNLGRETALATVARAIMMAGGFLGTILFARILGPTSFGSVYLLLAVVKLADRPMTGWAMALKKRVSETPSQMQAALGTQLLFNTGWIVLLGSITIGLGGVLRSYTGLSSAPILFVVLLATASNYETLERLVQARGRISAASWIDTLRSYLTLPLQLGLVLLGLGATGMIVGLAGASLLVLPAIGYTISFYPRVPSIDLVRRCWEFARYSIPNSALGTIYDRLDVLLLGALLSPAAAGHYEVAWKLTLPAMFVAQSAASGLMAKVSGLDAQDKAVGEDVRNTISFSSMLALPVFVGAVVLSTDLVRVLYGREYIAAAPLLVGLAGFRVLRTQSGPLLQTVNGLDRPEVTMRLSGLAVVVNVVLGIALTLAIGPLGVVVATVIAEAVRYIGVIVLLRRELSSFSPVTRPITEQIGAAAIMGTVVACVRTVFPAQIGILELGWLLGLGAGAYAAVLVVGSPQLRVTLRGMVE